MFHAAPVLQSGRVKADMLVQYHQKSLKPALFTVKQGCKNVDTLEHLILALVSSSIFSSKLCYRLSSSFLHLQVKTVWTGVYT